MAPAAAIGSLELRTDSGVQGYVLSLLRSGSIRGHVKDADGKPIRGVRVAVVVPGYREGRRTFFNGAESTTNEQGEYRLVSLGPAEYYLRATRLTFPGIPAYYPGVTEIERAAPITIVGNEDLDGIDINLTDSPGFQVSGSLFISSRSTGISLEKPNAQFMIVPAGGTLDEAVSPMIRNPIVNPDGKFIIRDVPSGTWDLFAILPTGTASPGATSPQRFFSSGRVRINVNDRDIENVTIVENSADVRGRVVVQPTGASAQRPATLRLSLIPQENIPSMFYSQIRNVGISSTGEFTFSGVPAGSYSLSFSIPLGFHISDVRIGPRSIYDSATFDVAPDRPDPLEITLKSGGGTVAGMLVDDLPRRPTERYLEPRIALVPLSLSQRHNILLYKTTSLSGPPGSFSFRNVPTGDYKVFAWEYVPPVDAEKNPEFVSMYEPFGASVTVVDGQTSKVQVQLIPFGR
jgi:hypothetical protein